MVSIMRYTRSNILAALLFSHNFSATSNAFSLKPVLPVRLCGHDSSGYSRRDYSFRRRNFHSIPVTTVQPTKGRTFARRKASRLVSQDGAEKRKKMSIRLPKSKQEFTWVAVMLSAIVLGVFYRHNLATLARSVDVEYYNQKLRMLLTKLDKAGNIGLLAYTVLLWLWTMTVGITTPVEIAAGFCFGAKRALLAGGCGKIGGALTAFFLGRYVYYERAHKKLQNNELLQLVEESTTEHPFLVAIMTRLSPMPELVKNVGMSIVDIQANYFAMALLLHGITFTCLWSWMGAETARTALGGSKPSRALKIVVSGMTWFGKFCVNMALF